MGRSTRTLSASTSRPADTAADETADALDFESGAATLADLAPWALAAKAAYARVARPGQREPAIYASASNLTAVCNALAAAHVTGVGLWVADWSDTPEAAAAALQASSGPYPVIGVQYQDAGEYDRDVFLASWVNTRSAKAKAAAPAVVKPAMPPGQWDDPSAWTWAEATITGTGMDGQGAQLRVLQGRQRVVQGALARPRPPPHRNAAA